MPDLPQGRETRPKSLPSRAAFFNRELSWLAFNRRVLEQATLEKHPLLERLKFLAIVASNLDEFFEIRVAGLVQQLESGSAEPSSDGLGPREQLRRIHSAVAWMSEAMHRCWKDLLRPALAAEGIHFRRADELDASETRWVREYFREQIFPLLTPMAVDPKHPFPTIANKVVHVLCSLDKPETDRRERMMAIIPVPRSLPRVVRIGGRDPLQQTYVFISSIIKACAADLFPGLHLNAAQVFRVTRNSDLYVDDEEAENLLRRIEEELRNLRRGAPVRLEIEAEVEDQIFRSLLDQLRLPHEYVFRLAGPLNMQVLFAVYDLIDRPDLKYPPAIPAETVRFESGPAMFAAIRRQDVLLHHPYETFQPVVDFISLAAADPDVVAIKQTLYRTSGDSPVVKALIDAARAGKQVTALIELKARFDEANNIQWARQMEEAGVQVMYGLVGHKIHAKVVLVVRREGKKLHSYIHFGTGNYNPRTARIYTDLSLFTARPVLAREAVRLFHALTGFGRTQAFRHLLVAPYNLHARIQALILAEAANARRGRPAHIIAKVNSLVDEQTIRNLYLASQAGVKIDLIVRGICALVPGEPGLSENITVRSIVGRFLEHARIFYFENAGREPVLLAGSSDWMPRNFFRRVEVVFPVLDPALRRRLKEEILGAQLADDHDARLLLANGAYVPPARRNGRHAFSSQQEFLDLAAAAALPAPELAARQPGGGPARKASRARVRTAKTVTS